MNRRERVFGEHREAICAAAAANKGTSIALVGSVARGDDGPDSDYDFLVTFTKEASLFDQAGLRIALRELLCVEVDVISVGGLNLISTRGTGRCSPKRSRCEHTPGHTIRRWPADG